MNNGAEQKILGQTINKAMAKPKRVFRNQEFETGQYFTINTCKRRVGLTYRHTSLLSDPN